MNFFRQGRQSDHVPAVARNQPMDARNVRAAHESLKAMRRISNELLQKAVHDLVNEQAEALRREKL